MGAPEKFDLPTPHKTHEQASSNALFNDAYDKSCSAFSLNSADTAIGAAGIAAVVAAVYLTRGRSLATAVAKDGVELGASRLAGTAAHGVDDVLKSQPWLRSQPLTLGERAVGNLESIAKQQPWLRNQAIGGEAQVDTLASLTSRGGTSFVRDAGHKIIGSR